MDIRNFASQFEISPVEENIDLLDYNKKSLMNYGPDKIIFEEDEPRLNNFSKERLNLRHYGAFEPVQPWKNDDFDLQFHDPEPRRWDGDVNWRNFHKADEPKMRQRIFHSDADPSVPSNGVSWTDMQLRVSRLRSGLKGYMPWFSESVGSIAAGKTGLNYNTPQSNADLVTREIDPYAFNIVDNKNVNRFNHGNLGGKYFLDRTTTDHVLPTSKYNLLFRTDTPLAPGGVNKLIRGDQKLSRLNESQARTVARMIFGGSRENAENTQRMGRGTVQGNRRFLQMLINNENKTVSEEVKYNQTLFLQNNPKKRIQMEIVSLLGLTDEEIRWMESKKNVNRAAYEQCMANVMEMIEAMDGVPVNKLQEIRNSIVHARIGDFKGGLAETDLNVKTRAVLEGRNGGAANDTADGKTRIWGGVETGPRRNSWKNMVVRGTNTKVGRLNADGERVHTFEGVCTAKRAKNELTNELRAVPDSVMGAAAYTVGNVNRVSGFDRLESDGDTEWGAERHYDYALKSWNDSHLIPRQFKR
jgi:hypothetical protein